jgi:YVTN family beta-propeller protein
MRNFIFLITCHFALVTILSAQWLEETIPVGDYPWGLVYNSTNNKVYCANDFSYDVTVINGATNSVITTIPVGDGPDAFAWNPIQNRTYVANYWSNTVSVIRDTIIEGLKNIKRLMLQA